MSLKTLIPTERKEDATKYPKATSVKFYREPMKSNSEFGLGEKDNEWDTAAAFLGAESPADFKAKFFYFVGLVKNGEATVSKKK
jgi:hypothetical protein